MFKSLLNKIQRLKNSYNLNQAYIDAMERYDYLWSGCCNDIGILYDNVKHKYVLEIETIYHFDDKEAERKYIQDLFKELSKWMDLKGYSKDGEISLLAAFDMQEKEFNTMEELYAYFKMLAEEKI